MGVTVEASEVNLPSNSHAAHDLCSEVPFLLLNYAMLLCNALRSSLESVFYVLDNMLLEGSGSTIYNTSYDIWLMENT